MTEDVRYCPICRTKTWHVDGVCEWADGHATMERARREQEGAPDDKPPDQAP